jgi:DUF971 family protein
MGCTPTQLDLDRATGLRITWSDGRESFYTVAHLRKWSPSAEARETRDELQSNPLAVLPAGGSSAADLRAESIEMIGNYAVRIVFSDGHRTGLYSWDWLRQIDPALSDDPPEEQT